MAKRAGYYEHETRVKLTEALIDRADDWQWFIDCTEDRFEDPGEIDSVHEFLDALLAVRRPYTYLASIVDSVGDFKPTFSTLWLKRLYDCILLRSGLMQPGEFGEHEGFYGLLGVASYATFLFNKLTGVAHPIDTRVLYQSNLHQLFDFDALHDEWVRLKDFAETVKLTGIESVVKILNGNLEGVDVSIDNGRVEALMDANFDADFLDFKPIESRLFGTWQEVMLHDMLLTSFVDGRVEPLVKSRDGESPNVSGWTEKMLLSAKAGLQDERAVCILEVVELAKWGNTPSKRSQGILVELAVDHAEKCIEREDPIYSLQCTAFNVLEYLIGEKLLDREILGGYRRNMGDLLADRDERCDIQFMQRHSLPMSKDQKNLLHTKTASFFKDSLEKVDSPQALIELYRNPLSAKYCNQEDAEKSLDLFYEHTAEVDVLTAELFYVAMVFFIDVLSNPNVDNEWARNVIISLRHIWQDGYYSRVVSGMQTFSTEVSASIEDVKTANRAFLAEPQSFARLLMLCSDDAILEILEEMSKHVLIYLVSRTTISEYYPDHVHVTFDGGGRSIDEMIANEVRRVYKERSYRLANPLGDQELMDGFFSRLSEHIQLLSGMIDVKPVYDEIVAISPGYYVFLPNPGGNPTLGHLTQLFPLLENVIRGIGEFFGIVPFRANRESFNTLKDVSAVLTGMIEKLRNLTETIQGNSEFLFVYYAMYSHNGFNIRNDCIHGRQYQDPSSVAFAYRLTVMCTYMMLKRLRGLEEVAKKNQD